MPKIKICHVVNIITGKSDGVYAHLKMLFQYLDADKYQHYLVFQGNPVIEEEVKSLGVIVFALPSFKKKFSLSTFLEVYHILKKNEIAIIHAHLLKPYIISGIVNIFLRKKAIFNYHGSFINLSVYYSYIEKTIYKIAHWFVYAFRSYQKVVVPSNASKNSLLIESSLFPGVEVYYNGYAFETKEGMSTVNPINIFGRLDPNSNKIGIVGRFEPQKRVDIALKIADQLLVHRNDIHFIFIGDGSLEEDFKRQIVEKQLSQYIAVYNFIPNIKDYLDLFDVILITSDWEGMPLIVWEAMAKGVPIVASDVGGIREIIEHEKCGKVFERRNVRQAVTIINELLNDKQLRMRMGEQGKNAIKIKYNEKKFANRFEEIYESVLKS